MNSRDAKRAFAKLSRWLESRGWTLERSYSKPDEADFITKKVTNRSRGTLQNQVFSVLHECGHIVTGGKKAVAKLLHVKYPVKRTRYHRVSTAVAEVRAWDGGERLAIRLGIRINHDAYERYRSKYLSNYFQWATRQKTAQKFK